MTKAQVWLRLHTTLHHQLWYNETEGPNTIVYGIKRKFQEPFQVNDMYEPKITQMNKVLYKQFTVMHSEGKPSTEPMIIKKSSVTLWWMNVIDSCTFLEDWLQNLKHQHLQDTYKWKTPLFSCAAQQRSSIKKLLLRNQFSIGTAWSFRNVWSHRCHIKWILL